MPLHWHDLNNTEDESYILNELAQAMETRMEQKLPLPPFTMETAIQKIRMAEDAWNTRDPEKVSLV